VTRNPPSLQPLDPVEGHDEYLDLYDHAPVGYLTLDSAGRISRINQAGGAMLSGAPRDLRSLPFRDFVMPQDLAQWTGYLDLLLEGGAAQSCQLLLRVPGRDPLAVQATSARAASAGKQAGSVRCALVDDTQRRRSDEERERLRVELAAMHQALALAQAKLMQSDKLAAIGQLAAGVAHEVSSPLAYVRSNLHVVTECVTEVLGVLQATERAEGACDAACAVFLDLQRIRTLRDLGVVQLDLKEMLQESIEGLERIGHLMADLRSFAHPDTGVLQEADLHAAIEAAIRIVAAAVSGRAKLVRAFGPAPLVLRCRPLQLQQVVMNLLLNASQAIAHGGTITLRTGRSGGLAGPEAWLEVEDSGSGILAEDMGRLFEPFFTTKPVGEGTGLGLSIAHGIVRGHGGRIEARSEPGVGSIFRVIIPVHGPCVALELVKAGSGRYLG
jgi:two-component system NtrC family sensor kinase